MVCGKHCLCFFVSFFLLEADTSLTDKDSHNGDASHIHTDEFVTDSDFFLKKLFEKYGKDGIMTFEGFEHLLESIGLGRLVILDHDMIFHGAAAGDIHSHSTHSHSVSLGKTPEIRSNLLTSDSSVTTVLPIVTNLERRNSSLSSVNASTTNTELERSPLQQESGKPETGEAAATNLVSHNDTHLSSLPEEHLHANKCLTVTEMFRTFNVNLDRGVISMQQFTMLCPAIVYELDEHRCNGFHDELPVEEHEQETNAALVWAYATAAVVVISLSGLLVVAVIPIIYGSFYQMLLQFLVALAVGSLTGDALLHLLPHALSTTDIHHHHLHEVVSDHHSDIMVWKGLVAVSGILLFFMAERLLTVISTRRKQQSAAQAPVEFKLMKGDVEMSRTVGEKLCKHKYNSYGYSYNDVTMGMLQGLNDCEDKDHHNCLEKQPQGDDAVKRASSLTHLDDLRVTTTNGVGRCPTNNGEGDHFVPSNREVDQTHNGVIVAEHEHRHHGHSHTHTHTVPASVSAVAWMVIMGDGLHNFSDGLAIGAAFANGITGGLSTSIAVFCHELPHELGDFAVLLKSGMTAKQALMYNGLSSVLCFLGMLLGVALGNVASISTWIFAGAAGMFVYIALVDMIPELNSTPTISTAADSDPTRLLVQFLGMSIGVSIMLLIALYEHDLRIIISE